MEAEIAGLLGTLVGACVSIGTTFLSNRHAIHLQTSADANERQEKARAFQRENLLLCQEVIQMVARLTAKGFHEDTLAWHAGTEWEKTKLSAQLDQDLATNKGKLSTLIERVAGDELRRELKSISWLLNKVLGAPSFQDAETALFAAVAENERVMSLLGDSLRKTY
jgi:hypothetical protein